MHIIDKTLLIEAFPDKDNLLIIIFLRPEFYPLLVRYIWRNKSCEFSMRKQSQMYNSGHFIYAISLFQVSLVFLVCFFLTSGIKVFYYPRKRCNYS